MDIKYCPYFDKPLDLGVNGDELDSKIKEVIIVGKEKDYINLVKYALSLYNSNPEADLKGLDKIVQKVIPEEHRIGCLKLIELPQLTPLLKNKDPKNYQDILFKIMNRTYFLEGKPYEIKLYKDFLLLPSHNNAHHYYSNEAIRFVSLLHVLSRRIMQREEIKPFIISCFEAAKIEYNTSDITKWFKSLINNKNSLFGTNKRLEILELKRPIVIKK